MTTKRLSTSFISDLHHVVEFIIIFSREIVIFKLHQMVGRVKIVVFGAEQVLFRQKKKTTSDQHNVNELTNSQVKKEKQNNETDEHTFHLNVLCTRVIQLVFHEPSMRCDGHERKRTKSCYNIEQIWIDKQQR